MNHKILAINPGSTSTKVAVYEDENRIFSENVEHTAEELRPFDGFLEQAGFRARVIQSVLTRHKIALSELSGVAGRGGDAQPHASNLGALLAAEIAEPLGINAYIYDAVTANELPEIALITGIPEIRKQSACHVLNAKAMSRKVAKRYGKSYEDLRLIVAHLGGGVSVSAHVDGRIVEMAGDDSGPFFAPERAGGILLMDLIDLCYSGAYTKKEMQAKIRGKGGLKAHFGTADCREIERMIEGGDARAKTVYEAMAYQIARGIGTMTPVLMGKVDLVILTGGLARSEMLTGMIAERVRHIAPVEIAPGEDEMEALSLGALRILTGEETARTYQRVAR